MRHEDIWRGIDLLAARNGLTASGLARLAGLDATAFNKSKRTGPDGKPRWPSTESLSKVLDAVQASFDDFAALVSGRMSRGVPLLGLAKAGQDGFFDEAGFPVGAAGWDEVEFPGVEATDGMYALEITGNSMEPVYRAGDRVVVAPGESVRVGDRVVVRTYGGEVMAKVLGHRSARRIELISANPDYPPRELAPEDVAWMARIVWATQ